MPRNEYLFMHFFCTNAVYKLIILHVVFEYLNSLVERKKDQVHVIYYFIINNHYVAMIAIIVWLLSFFCFGDLFAIGGVGRF